MCPFLTFIVIFCWLGAFVKRSLDARDERRNDIDGLYSRATILEQFQVIAEDDNLRKFRPVLTDFQMWPAKLQRTKKATVSVDPTTIYIPRKVVPGRRDKVTQ